MSASAAAAMRMCPLDAGVPSDWLAVPHRLVFDCPLGTAAALAAAPRDADTRLDIDAAGRLVAVTDGAGAERLLAHDWRGAAELLAWLAPDHAQSA